MEVGESPLSYRQLLSSWTPACGKNNFYPLCGAPNTNIYKTTGTLSACELIDATCNWHILETTGCVCKGGFVAVSRQPELNELEEAA